MTSEALDARSIRVFVSSTFRDMQPEREELVKRVFPAIRKLCEQRGVAFTEVDLRWGVTDEQKAEGAVLPICLAEIDRSRPYFIGLLGQRYGWVPESFPEDLAAQLPWLRPLVGTSVTELEVVHGVLNDPQATGQSSFYFRDPAWTATAPPDELELFGEQPSAEEVASLGIERAEAAAVDRRTRLEDLKRRVVATGIRTRTYAGVRSLGEQVVADLTALVERTYPVDEVPDATARDAASHAAYAAAQLRGHVARPRLLDRLDALVDAGGSNPVAVTGDAGCGATEDVVSWLARRRVDHPADIVVEHHVRANADAADWIAMANRLTTALATAANSPPPDASPADAAGARAALFAAIGRAGVLGARVVVVVDRVDLLTDVDGAPDLTWLPMTLPASVRVVLTTTDPRPADEARRRGWIVETVPRLDDDERRHAITTFLGRYAKGLDAVHVQRLVAADATGNPLYLRTVLDELRQHGDHFTIGAVLEHYLAAPSLTELFALVLARYEGDFERERPGLVGDAMRALWAGRRGLTERELLTALGDGAEPLAQAVWSPLLLAAELGLVTRSGLLSFADEPMRAAVEARYLRADEDRRAAHGRLARLFAAEDLGPRVVEELPWQQLAAGDIDALVATISDLDFTVVAHRLALRDLIRLWARAEEAGRRVVDGYRAVVDEPAAHAEVLWEVARLVTDAGYPPEAARLHRVLVDGARATAASTDDRRPLGVALVNLGRALLLQGELDAAIGPLHEALAVAGAGGLDDVARAATGNLALARRDQGRLDDAAILFTREAELCRAADDTDGLQSALGNHAQVLRQRGDADGALAMMDEQERLCRSVGDAAGVARALAAQGAVLGDRGRLEESLRCIVAHRAIATDLGDLRGVAESGISEATTLRELGRTAEAAAMATQTEALLRRLDDGPLLARVLDVRARTAVDDQRWADAAQLAGEAVLTARRVGAGAMLHLPLGVLGMARRELGDLVGARRAHDEEAAIATELGDPVAAAVAQGNLAAVDIVGGDLVGALARYAGAVPVLSEHQAHGVLIPMLSNRAEVRLHAGDTSGAIDDLAAAARSASAVGATPQRRDLALRVIGLLAATGRAGETEPHWLDVIDADRILGDRADLQRALGECALLAIGRSELERAAALLDEQEAICAAIGDDVGLSACVGNRAIVLRQAGDLDGSLRCLDHQLDLTRRTNNGQGYLIATANRGEVLGILRRRDEALAALTEARTMAAGWGLTPMLAQLDQMIAALR